jgi:hypothetical protein
MLIVVGRSFQIVRLVDWLVTRRPCGQTGPTTPMCKHTGARCEHRDRRDPGAPPASSPNAVFPQRLDQCLQARQRFCADRSPIFEATFRSPATAAPFSASIPGSKFPACLFRSRLYSIRPVRPFGSTTSAGSPQPRLLQRLKPVA